MAGKAKAKKSAPKKEIWVAGYPSFYGGADTELDHNIDLWVKYGVDVHLVPLFGEDPKMREKCDARGCTTHKYESNIFKDKIVTSFCNGEFLKRLPEIMSNGKPAKVIWFNCMTWTFPDELRAHKEGWIDLHGFVSKFQEQWLRPQLEKVNPVTNKLEGYRPNFKPTGDMFRYTPPKDFFHMGRISRDDGGKFSEDMWNIFYKVCSPIPTKTFILGWGENAARKCGPAPAGLDWMTRSPNSIPAIDHYHNLHCIIHKTGGSRESYCRIVPEAYAHGVPIIVEKDYAFPELIIDGETGFLCETSDEMSYKASMLAFDEKLRKKVILQAQRHLMEGIASETHCWEAWEAVL